MVEKIIAVLKDLFPDRIQMFDTPCLLNDQYDIIFKEGNVEVRWCEYYSYVDVLGLSDEDFEKVFCACGYNL